MLKTINVIRQELSDYASPDDKLARLVRDGVYIPVVKGLYASTRDLPGELLAIAIYGPSYLSFEYALAYHGLIPERVYNYTSASLAKKRRKEFITEFGTFTYQDIPERAYPHGLIWKHEGDYAYLIAGPEKAVCDQLYKEKPLANYKELEELLFNDLRIDMDEFMKLKKENIYFLADKYGSRNVRRLANYMRRLDK